ncbi:MAG: 6-pyruvoyl-tetrahydropterin synthase-related protein, partial [Chloroflexota bacterium]|nr:6-pyruvoyl-tetrahydropterin synthase-related protein [Chloroflexota bacterium]
MPKRTSIGQRAKGLCFALALLLSIPAWLPLLRGFVNTRVGGDSPFLFFRLHQLLRNLQAGVFPARWMPDAAYGQGYPFFNFYASLPYYLAALFKLWGFGYIWAVKLTQIIGFIAAAGAMYILAKRLLDNQAGALLAALIYTYAPFHLVNVYVRGDSLSEFYAFVFYPLVLWTLLRLKEAPSRANIALVAFAYGGLILTHNISALIFTPFIGLWLIAYGLWPREERRIAICHMPYAIRNTPYAIGGIGLGLALSAWFWLPALLERGSVQLEGMTSGYFHYSGHFRSLDLIQASPLFDYSVDGSLRCFAMGSIQAALALLGTASIIAHWLKRRRIETRDAFLLVGLFVSTFFITPLSRPLWDHLPLLPFVQFPWRFLSVQAFFASLVSGRIVGKFRRSHAVAVALGLAAMATSMLKLRPEYLPLSEADITTEQLSIYEYFTANVGTTVRSEYLPRWVETRPFTSEMLLEGSKPPPKVLEGTLEKAELVELGPTHEEWLLDVSSPSARLAFHTYYFPGWRARVDGEPREVEPVEGLGYIGLDLGQGEHRVILCLERTPLRAFAEALSLLAFIIAIGLVTTGGLVASHHLKAFGIALASIALVAVLLRLLPSPRADASDLTMDFVRMPYLHHNPKGVRFGEVARLMSYSFSSDEVEAGEALEVTLRWAGVASDELTAEVSLVSAAEHLFHVPACLATSSAPLQAGMMRYQLRVPETAMRSLYLIKVRVWKGKSEVEPVTERGEPLGTIYLRPIRVRNRIEAAGDEPVIARFGPSIVLSEAEVQ